jgi:nitroreductase
VFLGCDCWTVVIASIGFAVSQKVAEMDTPHPTAAAIAEAVALAAHAPSVHNTQPWQWRVTSTSLDLFADRTRRLQASDPHGRMLLLSCGATLHHLAVAMGAAGWAADIQRLPDPRQPTHLARITLQPAQADEAMVELAAAITARRSDRRPMSSWPVPEAHIRRLVQLAAEHGALAWCLDPDQLAVWRALSQRADRRRALPEYRTELYDWTHRPDAAGDGIPPANRLSLDHDESQRVNRLPPGDIPLAPSGSDDGPRPASLLLATSSDDTLSRLRAGEALSAILLDATRLGLATAIDSQAVEMESTRSVVEHDVLQGSRSPQVLVTVGWPSSADPIPTTPRRDVTDIMTSTVADDGVLSAQQIRVPDAL